MPVQETYVPDSDEEKSNGRGRNSAGTKKSQGPSQKRRRSKSPAPKQNKRKKSDSAQDDGKSTKSNGSKKSKKKPTAALTLDERTVKNAASRISTMEKRQARPPREELADTIERIKKTASPAYETFDQPKLVKPRAKGGRYIYHGFQCKSCRTVIKRRIVSMETSSLLRHQTQCELRKHQGLLSEYGITGGSGPPSMYDVRQYVVLWVCEDGRPFAIVYDRYLRKLLPVEITKLLPCPATIVKDISTVYRMTQNSIRKMLAGIRGVFHIALDMYQSGNGYDYLGVVLFHPGVKDNTMFIERFVLECLSFSGKHTGLALANTLYAILHKFEVQDRVWGVVCDNVSNNADMMNRFTKLKMLRLTGPESRIHCLPHILNLASKAIAKPFIAKRAKLEKLSQSTQRKNNEATTLSDEEAGSEDEDKDDDGSTIERETICDDASVAEDYDPIEEDETGEDDGTAPSRTLAPDDEDDEELSDIVIPPEIAGSLNARELKALRKALYKIAWLARKLRYSPHFKKLFVDMCEVVDAMLPHNVRRDVITRWNSTKSMIEDALRLEEPILKFQKNPIYPADKHLTRHDFKVMKHLLKLLKPLSTLTEIMSKSLVPMLADVLVHFDSLNHEFCTMALDNTLPLWAREAANRARQILNKYYAITDTSIMYRLALLLHPSNREAYLRRLGWPDEWIMSARQALLTTWERYYKPEDYDNGVDDTLSQSQFGYSSFADEVYGSLAEEGERTLDPVTAFIEGKPIIERTKSGKSKPVNPLNWWYAQRLVGEEHDGLTQLALDVLTAPASSVEVERAFSFVSNMVSKRRHSMLAFTVQATATLGAYSRADLVPSGALEKAHRKARERNQANARAKAAEAQAKAAVAEARAIAAEQDRSEDEQTEGDETPDNEDEDVLDPSSDVEDADLMDDD